MHVLNPVCVLSLQDPHAEEFEDKEWTFVIENVSNRLYLLFFGPIAFYLCLSLCLLLHRSSVFVIFNVLNYYHFMIIVIRLIYNDCDYNFNQNNTETLHFSSSIPFTLHVQLLPPCGQIMQSHASLRDNPGYQVKLKVLTPPPIYNSFPICHSHTFRTTAVNSGTEILFLFSWFVVKRSRSCLKQQEQHKFKYESTATGSMRN